MPKTTQVNPYEKVVQIPFEEISPFNINVRFTNNRDVGTMRDEIEREGFITTPIEVWEAPKGFKQVDQYGYQFGTRQPDELPKVCDDKITEKYIPIKGYRRIAGVKSILNDEEANPALRNAVRTFPAIVRKEVKTLQEAEMLVMDHNSVKDISPSETLRSVFRRADLGESWEDIAINMFARITKNIMRRSEGAVERISSIPSKAERHRAMKKEVNNYISYFRRAYQMGLKDQVILFWKKKDNLLTPDDRLYFQADLGAFSLVLSKAWEEDLGKDRMRDKESHKDEPNVASPIKAIHRDEETGEIVYEGGGPNLRKALTDLINQYFGVGEAEEEKPKVMSPKDLEDRIRLSTSEHLSSVLNLVRGNKGEVVHGLETTNQWCLKWEAIDNLIAETLKANNQDPFVMEILHAINVGKESFAKFLDEHKIANAKKK